MATTASYIPEGLTAITPYLLVPDPIAAIDFYKDVFGATEIMRHEEGGEVVHAKLRIGGTVVEVGLHGPRAAVEVADLPPVGSKHRRPLRRRVVRGHAPPRLTRAC